MATIADVLGALEAYAPPSYQESYDNAGLLCGDRSKEVTAVLCCLDSTEAVVEEAISKGCNLIVAHHPIIFSGLKSLTGKNYVERTIIKAIKNDVAIYAAHTNLDNVRLGVNDKICEVLGLENRRTLAPKGGLLRKLAVFTPAEHASKVRTALFEAGAGKIGDYDNCSFNSEGTGTFRPGEGTKPFSGTPGEEKSEAEVKIEVIYPAHIEKPLLQKLISAHPYEEVAYDIFPLHNTHPQVGSGMIGELPSSETGMAELDFLKMVKEKLGTECIRHTWLLGRPVKKVAVCGGAGGFLLKDAIRAGADVFVTADYKYHEFFDADSRILIADVGHYESESFTIDLLAEVISKKFSTFAVHLTSIITNPIKYI